MNILVNSTKVFNTTETERRKRAATDYAKKISLENKFTPELNRYFSKLSQEIFNSYVATGTIPTAHGSQIELKELLKKHYRRVFRNFDGLSEDLQKNRLILLTKQDEAIQQQNDEFIDDFSTQQSQIINNTNNKEIKRVFTAAIVAAIAASKIPKKPQDNNVSVTDIAIDLDISRNSIAQSAANLFKDRSRSRSRSIALTETQASAEKAKSIAAAETLKQINESAGDSFQEKDKKLTKQWVAILDNVTRDSHAEADGQIQNVTDPFIVQGQSLMEPGDTSLGATVDNIINCRCSAQYFTK